MSCGIVQSFFAAEYAEIKALADKQNNPLGSAVGLVSQLNESKIMAAKTSFTERTL